MSIDILSNSNAANVPLLMDDSAKKEAYKMKKERYHSEKRRVARELVSTFKDPTVVVMADWLKIRGTLRTWTKMYCVLKPGLLLIYKGPKTHKYGYWIGTVLLSTCELIERPSKRDGFCFKLFHPLDQSIWATRGPQGENFGAVTQPLPGSYLICRAASQEAGRCWMDGLELALKCSSLLMRTMSKLQEGGAPPQPHHQADGGAGSKIGRQADSAHRLSSMGVSTTSSNGGKEAPATAPSSTANFQTVEDTVSDNQSLVLDQDLMTSKKILSDTEAERHFSFGDEVLSDSDNELSPADGFADDETNYEPSPPEVFGALGDSEQTEEVADENKSLIWTLMKQVRPGMDLSKVVLPTFILEPRSFLEKLADSYYHADLLCEAVNEDDPFKRMKAVVKFYLSGFYKKPKGLKKPYNPILGEKFRCFWRKGDENDDDDDDDSAHGRTFYVAEQVSHHPPVSAFFASNRKAGYNVAGSILARSKFYGNSLSAILIGNAKISLLNRGETYTVNLPYAHCKGLILGTLSMELGGSIQVVCDRTSYTTELEFKLKPFLAGSDSMNVCTGKIKLGKETLADLTGHWDSAIYLNDRQTGKTEVFWQPTQDTIAQRLKRFEVPLKHQDESESQRLWSKVTEAIKNNDQYAATMEKTFIEEEQRKKVKERRERGQEDQYRPALFELDHNSGFWTYKHADYRPWDKQNDLEQYERNFVIKTRVRHRTPLIRTASLSGTAAAGGAVESSAAVGVGRGDVDDQSSEDEHRHKKSHSRKNYRLVEAGIAGDKLKSLEKEIFDLNSKINAVLYKLDRQTQSIDRYLGDLRTNLYLILAIVVVFQAVWSLFEVKHLQ